MDAGYTRMVTPAELLFVGVLLLVVFAVVLADVLPLLIGARGAVGWAVVLLLGTARPWP
jgi:hypothetical protein